MFFKLLLTAALLVSAATGFSQDTAYMQSIIRELTAKGFPNSATRLRLCSITLTDKGNELLRPPALDTSLIQILLAGVNTGAIKAYSAANESLALTPEQLHSMLSAGSPVFNPDSVTKLKMKEEWTFQRNKGRMVVRIICIAPIIKVRDAAGALQEQPAFWVHYPEFRKFLTTQKVIAPSKEVKIKNLADVFDGRNFVSKILK